MVSGEDPVDLASSNLGMTALKISATVLSHTLVTVETKMATKNSDLVQPSFTLPPNMLGNIDESGNAQDKSVTSTNWATNSYTSQDSDREDSRRLAARLQRHLTSSNDDDGGTSGALQNGSSVTSLSVIGSTVTNLTDPIIMTLSLPTTLLAASDLKDNATFELNCSKNETVPAREAWTSQDVARADYCGYTLDDVEVEVRGSNAKREVYCSATETYHTMDCNGTTGLINFTCKLQGPDTPHIHCETR